ncbi:transposase [Pseudomonadota bacterium]
MAGNKKSFYPRISQKWRCVVQKKGEYNLWQRRYWEHQIRDETDMQHHIDYIHYNPVKHGHVDRVKDWPYSSFHRYVKNGLLSEDWGDKCNVENNIGYGE